DAIEVLRGAGHKVIAVPADDPAAAMGVNDRAQLADAEAALRGRINRRWMLDGVTMVDPSRTYIDATVALEPDVRILPGTILEGRTSIAAGAVVGPDSHLVDTIVGERTKVANTVAREVEIGDDCQVGPYAYLPPGTLLAAGATRGRQTGSGGAARRVMPEPRAPSRARMRTTSGRPAEHEGA